MKNLDTNSNQQISISVIFDFLSQYAIPEIEWHKFLKDKQKTSQKQKSPVRTTATNPFILIGGMPFAATRPKEETKSASR